MMPNKQKQQNQIINDLMLNMQTPKSEQYMLRLTSQEKECFQKMAETKGLSLASLIRALLWEEYRRVQVDTKDSETRRVKRNG